MYLRIIMTLMLAVLVVIAFQIAGRPKPTAFSPPPPAGSSFLLKPATGRNDPVLARRIDRVELKDATIDSALRQIAEVSKANMIWSPSELGGSSRRIMVQLTDTTLGEVLRHVLEFPGEFPIFHAVVDGVILIGSSPDLADMELRVYPVYDLLSGENSASAWAADTVAPIQRMERLKVIISKRFAPEFSRESASRAVMREWDGTLVICLSPENHAAIPSLLDSLSIKRQRGRFKEPRRDARDPLN